MGNLTTYSRETTGAQYTVLTNSLLSLIAKHKQSNSFLGKIRQNIEIF